MVLVSVLVSSRYVMVLVSVLVSTHKVLVSVSSWSFEQRSWSRLGLVNKGLGLVLVL